MADSTITVSKENDIFFCRNLEARSGTESASSKNLIPTLLWHLHDFLSLDGNVRYLQDKKQKNSFLFASWRKQQDPDPLVRGPDPRIRIRTKMSRIPITAPDPIKFPQKVLLSRCKFRITRIRTPKGSVKFKKNRMSASLCPSSSSPSSTSMILVWLSEEEPIDFQPYSSRFDSE